MPLFTEHAASAVSNFLCQHWYAVQVVPRHEKRVAALLQYKGYDQFVPLQTPPRYSRGYDDRALFPGYVFCRLESAAHGLVVTTPGVIRILGFGGVPVPLSAEEVWNLRRISDSRVAAEAQDIFRIGNPVQIESGPLIGMVGLLVEIRRKHKIAVSVELLSRSVTVELHDWTVRQLRGSETVAQPSIQISPRLVS